MIELIWDEKFKILFKKWSEKHPDLKEQFRNKMELFVIDPFHPSLKTHSLSGILNTNINSTPVHINPRFMIPRARYCN